jgi:hypothetical protein
MKRLFITAVAIAASTAAFSQAQTSAAPETPATPATPAVPVINAAIETPADEIESDTIQVAAVNDTVAASAVAHDETRRQIKIDELPAAVRSDLNTPQYKGWTPSVAYQVSADKKDWYEITVVKGDESKVVKYNSEGSKLD